jgi:YVTN family beta-propeller protein
VALTRDGKSLLVTIQAKNTLMALDAASLKARAEIKVGRYPEDVVASADGTIAYVADWFSDAISVVDLVRGKETRQIAVAAGPRDLVVVP